ncbi:hypothetical protein FH593_09990 [Leptospira interrogans]|uniref:Uncharacterized protein n=2 Tax=Leptospira interrogans TaxID=173 RepID=M6ZN47_LEPIR|nr:MULTISPECIES: hypothetical protein [Leptospira]EMM97179.1 hypothetical protein LEP1GSC158_3380 [Leptospira interrogans serovar Zanoni str. LT2156]EMP07496.1 hypothetical protein LEP1GSC124_5119 [Leptospira interrogans serovar Pyrogenes str. 200701872]EKO08788.1 hypothetical protein LEP1GSC077_3660 [Leptospira interrogans str. C10069]EKR16783.1 hypothetical protein LEP1GSC019_4412 [Leptospira interrogans serovar Pyrogenes str. 2006006960]EMN60997.1 hypothetical protein LEP1GSC092_0012 [Lepto
MNKADPVNLLNDRVSKIEENQKKEEFLLKNIEHADQIIQRHSTIFTAIGTYSTIVGIFIGIMGILSAIVTYLFGILPARESVNNLEMKLDEFLKREKSKTIESLITDLNSNDSLKQNKSASKLSINLDYNYTTHNSRSTRCIKESKFKLYSFYYRKYIITSS